MEVTPHLCGCNILKQKKNNRKLHPNKNKKQTQNKNKHENKKHQKNTSQCNAELLRRKNYSHGVHPRRTAKQAGFHWCSHGKYLSFPKFLATGLQFIIGACKCCFKWRSSRVWQVCTEVTTAGAQSSPLVAGRCPLCPCFESWLAS